MRGLSFGFRSVVLLILSVAACQAQQLTPAQHFEQAKQDVARCLAVADSVNNAMTLDDANRIVDAGAPICHEAHRHFEAIPPSSSIYAESQQFRNEANRKLQAARDKFQGRMKAWIWNLEDQGWSCHREKDVWLCKQPERLPHQPTTDSELIGWNRMTPV